MSQKYGGKLIDDYSAMQGPCPEEFHIPSTDEWVSLCGILTTTFSMEGNATTMGTYLKMPMAGYLYNTSGNIGGVGVTAQYWSSSASSSNYAYHLRFHSSSFYPHNQARRTYGDSIRCFKDIPVIPTSSWTTLYQGTGSAGIFRNSSLGLISVSGDGITWYTIQDKNLGATTVFNQGDTLTDDNCGHFYQWGNNYGFSHSGTVTASSTQVNAIGYGPGNYYLSSTFITGYNDWSNVQNDNLRGGETGVQQRPANIIKKYYGGKTIDDYSAMRGPCSEGFHIPLHTEWESLISAMNSIELSYSDYEQYLLMPYAGMRDTQSNIYDQYEGDYEGASGQYRASDAYISGGVYDVYFFGMNSGYGEGVQTMDPTLAFNIRPFKDGSVMPDNTRVRLYNPPATQYGQGIYHNATLGLISIVYRAGGTKCITIADKNVGATTAYTKGGTITESTCGNYFQWGNNYGFPLSGTVSTSGTAVDTTGYGPGNYYSSSTYITGNPTNHYIRFDPKNSDLRGGVIGIQHRHAKVKKVYYGGKLVDNYSAMRGPCPEGFHVPMIEEWRGLIGTLATVLSIGPDGVAMKTYLKMPLAGFRNFPGGGEDSQGSIGNYWTSTKRLGVNVWCIAFDASSTPVNLQNYSSSRTYGYSVRGFKDSPIIPDNSWTILYDGSSIATGAGVFHNAALGLISVSGDGTTWYTIQDKNLGATIVYNDGATLSEANCGKYYQRGNNYGFPRTGTMTMSSIKVDASGYGPGNYYSSDTFITGSGDWSSVRNDNLRGGVTGVQQKPILIREDNS